MVRELESILSHVLVYVFVLQGAASSTGSKKFLMSSFGGFISFPTLLIRALRLPLTVSIFSSEFL